MSSEAKRQRVTVYLSAAQHGRAERMAEKAGDSISGLLARGLVAALRDRPEARNASPRGEGEIKTTVFLSRSLHARAKRATVEGGTLQDLIVHGLELVSR